MAYMEINHHSEVLQMDMTFAAVIPEQWSAKKNRPVIWLLHGGYGCIQVALTHSEVFGNAGAFAAGDMEDKPYRKTDTSNWSKNRQAIMGTGDIHETQYSLKYCARMLLDSEKPLPRIYHACGRMDPWYEMNQMVRGFFEGLKENPYRYHYAEYLEHGHTYPFIEQALKDYIRAMEILYSEKS